MAYQVMKTGQVDGVKCHICGLHCISILPPQSAGVASCSSSRNRSFKTNIYLHSIALIEDTLHPLSLVFILTRQFIEELSLRLIEGSGDLCGTVCHLKTIVL